MRKSQIFLKSLFLVLLLVTSGTAEKLKVNLDSKKNQQEKAKEAPPIVKEKPSVKTSAGQMILVDMDTFRVLAEYNPDERTNPSSMMKVMTVYQIKKKIASGEIKPDAKFKVSEKAWRTGGSKMFVDLGSEIPLKDLLQGIIVVSGNDACVVCAEGASGDEGAFVNEMNESARDLGCTGTHFVNSHGLHHPDHYTTVRDLAIIAIAARNNFPETPNPWAQQEFEYNGIKQSNRNPLLNLSIGCDGMKTGFTDEGKYGIIATATQHASDAKAQSASAKAPQRLVLVINGVASPTERKSEAVRLLSWGFSMFENHRLYKDQEVVTEIPVWQGSVDTVKAVAKDAPIVSLLKTDRPYLKVKVKHKTPLKAPIAKGDEVGELIVEAPSLEEPFIIKLAASESVEQAGFFKKIKDSLYHLIFGGIKDSFQLDGLIKTEDFIKSEFKIDEKTENKKVKKKAAAAA